MLDDFLALSADLTGFSAFDLSATGQARPYLDTLTARVGTATAEALIDAHDRARAEAGGDTGALTAAIRRHVLSDPRIGPVARNVIKMWYVGSWYEMPAHWRQTHGGAADGGETAVVSPEAYTEGLLWPAIGANPSGAKPFGYGTWAMPPRVTPAGST